MFAIMGVTGQVGGAVARTLLASGNKVRVIVRDEPKAKAWRALGCEIAVADLAQPETMAAALSGTDGAFLMLPPTFDPSPGFSEAKARIEALYQAAIVGRPKRVAVLSTIGANSGRPNLLNQLTLLEDRMATLPMAVSFVRAAWFMENAAWDVGPACAGKISSFLQPLDREFPMVSTEDVGRVAAECLLGSDDGIRVIELEGPERVSPNAVADAFRSALGSPVNIDAVPRDTWEALFRSQGMTNPTPRIQMLDGFNEGWIEFGDAHARVTKGRISITQVITALLNKEASK
jgi:uncharacterized protein YbjT (DUF2867 family)